MFSFLPRPGLYQTTTYLDGWYLYQIESAQRNALLFKIFHIRPLVVRQSNRLSWSWLGNVQFRLPYPCVLLDVGPQQIEIDPRVDHSVFSRSLVSEDGTDISASLTRTAPSKVRIRWNRAKQCLSPVQAESVASSDDGVGERDVLPVGTAIRGQLWRLWPQNHRPHAPQQHGNLVPWLCGCVSADDKAFFCDEQGPVSAVKKHLREAI